MTWRIGKGIVGWSFIVPAKEAETPSQVLRRAVVGTLAALPHFARASTIGFSTASDGEDSVVLNGNTAEQEAVPTFDRLADVIKLELYLELHCINLDGGRLVIPDGAFLFIDWDRDDDRVSIYLSLNASIYAWRTIDDNSAHAELNAPLLTRFLSDLQLKVGAVFDGVNTNDYDVDENGFVKPS